MTWPSAVAARFFPTFKNILKLRLKNVQIGYVISVCLCLVTCGYTYVCTICQRQVELEAPSLQGHTRVTRLHRRRHPCTCPRCGIHTGAYAHTYLHLPAYWGQLGSFETSRAWTQLPQVGYISVPVGWGEQAGADNSSSGAGLTAQGRIRKWEGSREQSHFRCCCEEPGFSLRS